MTTPEPRPTGDIEVDAPIVSGRTELECGCRYELDVEKDHGLLVPCGELHRTLAQRMRKPGARWDVTEVRR